MIRAQNEDPFESSSEATTESSLTTTIQAGEAPENPFITCDFDLENIENLLPFLPDICAEIYYNRTENDYLYNLYVEESQNYAKFYKKLNDYELRDQPNGDKEELSEYPFEGELRYESYNKVDVSQCVTLSNTSAIEYLKCLKDKRLKLSDLIPNVAEEK